jgi:hypothetical protein
LPALAGQAAGQVLRGGSFNNNQNNAAASYRNNNNPNNRNNNNGFRVVCAAHNLLTLQKMILRYRLLPKVAGVYRCPFAAKAEG